MVLGLGPLFVAVFFPPEHLHEGFVCLRFENVEERGRVTAVRLSPVLHAIVTPSDYASPTGALLSHGLSVSAQRETPPSVSARWGFGLGLVGEEGEALDRVYRVVPVGFCVGVEAFLLSDVDSQHFNGE